MNSVVIHLPVTVQLGDKEVQVLKVKMAVVDEADIPYSLWRDHVSIGIPRSKLIEYWEMIVTPLMDCLLR